MADEIRVTGPGTPAPPPERRADAGAPPPPPPPPPGAPVPPPAPIGAIEGDPDAARAEIEMTRARMSETINEIEGVLVRHKEQIQEKLDIFSPIKENPLPAGGIAFGAGLLLGLLTGGDDEEEERDGRWTEREPVYASVPWQPRRRSTGRWEPHFNTEEWGYVRSGGRTDSTGYGEEGSSRERADTWESRARRLREVARQQEEEIRDLQERWGEDRAGAFDSRAQSRAHDWEDEEERGGGFFSDQLDSLRDRVATGISGYVTRAVQDFLGQGGASRRA